jgi:hypothetical protein
MALGWRGTAVGVTRGGVGRAGRTVQPRRNPGIKAKAEFPGAAEESERLIVVMTPA